MARREDVPNATYPKAWTPLPLDRRFTATEYELLAAGFISESMDDHWDIYLEEDTLYFHRSWTGICIFRVRLEKAADEYAIADAAIGDYPWAKPSDPYVADLEGVIDLVLLRKPNPILRSLAEAKTKTRRRI